MGTGYGLAKIINQVLQRQKLQIIKFLRMGPRFLIALCLKNKKRVYIKINLYSRHKNHDCRVCNEHLAREITFLQLVNRQNKFKHLKQGVPLIYAADIKSDRTWFVKEYTEGTFQNINDSNFLFKNSFFNQTNLNWVVKFFDELHAFSLDLPAKTKKTFHYHDMADYLRLINKKEIATILKSQAKVDKIYQFLNKRENLFNKNQLVLTHFEPYAAHFIKNQASFKVIDWENIGWSNVAHDLGVIWLRAYEHPIWQKKLVEKVYQTSPLAKNWPELFKVELLIQIMANLPYLLGTTDPDEKKVSQKIISFMSKQIDLILNNKFKAT